MSLSQSPLIRLAESSDIPALVVVHRDSAEFHRRLDAQLYRIPDGKAVTEMFAQALASPDTAVFVAEAEGQVVGYVQVRIVPPAREASMIQPRAGAEVGIAVLTAFRRRGLGTALMRAAQAWVVQQGAEFMLLDCHAANAAAIRLYEQLGFQTVGYLMNKRLLPPSADESGNAGAQQHLL